MPQQYEPPGGMLQTMITNEQYQAAVTARDAAQATITAYHAQSQSVFAARWLRFNQGNAPFQDDELRYAAGARCETCSAGLAYPKDCGGLHQWDCSDILTGRRTDRENHESYPFAFYEIKSEDQPSAHGATTRPVKSTPN